MQCPRAPGSGFTLPASAKGAGHSRDNCPPLAFITSHARVLLAIAQDPELRIGEIADATGVTMRTAYRLVADLVEAGYLRRTRVGTHNHYEVDPDLPLGDPIVGQHTLSDLLSFVAAQERISPRLSAKR